MCLEELAFAAELTPGYTLAMSLAVVGLNPPLRIVPDEYVSVEDFWRLSGENPDLRMERAANGELILITPTLGGSSFRTSYINRVLENWADADGRGSVLDSNAGCNLPDGSVLCPDAAWISLGRWTPPPPDADTHVPCPEFVIGHRYGVEYLGEARWARPRARPEFWHQAP